MIIASLIFLLPLIAYSVQIILWYIQWIRTDDFVHQPSDDIALSLIIPFKDEAEHLPALIESLQQQTHTNWELILVNDHSEDDSVNKLQYLISTSNSHVRIIHSNANGKKAALLEGAQQAQYDYIVCSDADCTFHPNWLSVVASYIKQHHPDLLIGPVSIKPSKGLLGRFQRIDFTALQLSGAAAALHQHAIMCNGANLMCNKELYLQAYLQPQLASGDDMFLLEWMKQQKKTIHFVKSMEAIVETAPLPKWSDFLQQRARWAAKAPHYKDRQIILSGLLVSSVNVLLVLSLLGSFFSPLFWKLFAFYLSSKCLVDYILLKAGATTYKLKITLFEVIFWQILYPFYVIAVLLYPFFTKLQWKSRRI